MHQQDVSSHHTVHWNHGRYHTSTIFLIQTRGPIGTIIPKTNMQKIKLQKVQVPKGSPLSDWFEKNVMEKMVYIKKSQARRMFGPRDKEHPF